eukprot:6440928-Prymnesium_polylepis.1
MLAMTPAPVVPLEPAPAPPARGSLQWLPKAAARAAAAFAQKKEGRSEEPKARSAASEAQRAQR